MRIRIILVHYQIYKQQLSTNPTNIKNYEKHNFSIIDYYVFSGV